MDEIRYMAATGMIGSGFFESSFEEGLRRNPHFIASDAGSTDDGPYQLGGGGTMFSRQACKRDLRIILKGALAKGIPFLSGTAGGAGANVHLQWQREIVEEIAREEGLHFRMALIDAEVDRSYLKRRLREGRIRPLDPAPELNEAVIDRSSHIVGMMGAEPFMRALEQGAQVILAGRSSDTSFYAAIPVMNGFPAGLAWHAAKVLECGAAAVTHRIAPDCMLCTMRHDHFVLEPLHPEMRCTPVSIAAHTLYENADPYRLYEPSGMLDTTETTYSAVSDRAVKVIGSRYVPSDRYTIKLEGAELVGYQSLVMGAVRDPVIIEQLDSWLLSMDQRIKQRLNNIFGRDVSDEYHMQLRIYGKNGAMGQLEPIKEIHSHEVFLMWEITAPTQDMASAIAASVGHMALHHPVPEWSGLISAIAFPHAPHKIDRGPVYRFNMNHLVEVDDPSEMFRTEFVDL